MPEKKRPVMLLIRDGWGHREETDFNATAHAKTPVHDLLFKTCPMSLLNASGKAVGLPEGIMGNSEVGHLNLGAGRCVKQEVVKINDTIEDGSFFENEAFLGAIKNAKEQNSSLHLWGLLSDGLVHSSMKHLWALLELTRRQKLEKVFVHCFTDGRDTPPHSAMSYVQQLEDKLKEIGVGRIATVIGRYYAMDRDNRWQRNELAYRALVEGKGIRALSAVEAVQASYDEGIADEFILPVVIESENQEPLATVKTEDSVIFFNFRADRARQISRAFFEPVFTHFQRPAAVFPHFATLTVYDEGFPFPSAFKPQRMENILAQVVSEAGLRQLRIAETEKYAHVTFFFSGGEESELPGEDRCLISSPKVDTYDLQPEMSALLLTTEVIKRIESGEYDQIILNFANPDMVGHTGIFDATVKACEVVDECVGKVLDAVVKAGGCALVTSDHGNCELMVHPDGEHNTQHTTSPVHCVLVDKSLPEAHLREGTLADVAPTLLNLMGLSKPAEMQGSNLVVK